MKVLGPKAAAEAHHVLVVYLCTYALCDLPLWGIARTTAAPGCLHSHTYLQFSRYPPYFQPGCGNPHPQLFCIAWFPGVFPEQGVYHLASQRIKELLGAGRISITRVFSEATFPLGTVLEANQRNAHFLHTCSRTTAGDWNLCTRSDLGALPRPGP